MFRNILRPGGLLLLSLASSLTAGYNGFRTIDNPGGGRIVYGPLNETSTQSAMGLMLRNVRDQFGETPKLGQVVHDDTGELLAEFFSVTARNDADRQIAGLVIVSIPRNGKARAAVLTDEAKRFPATLDPMLAQLQNAVGGAH